MSIYPTALQNENLIHHAMEEALEAGVPRRFFQFAVFVSFVVRATICEIDKVVGDQNTIGP